MKIKITGKIPKAQFGISGVDSLRNLAGQTMDFEFKKGSASGTGLKNWGYKNSQLPQNQVPSDWKPPTSKDEAVNLYMKEIAPRLNNFQTAMEKGAAGDFLYNTGRDPRVYMLDQYLQSIGKSGLQNRSDYSKDTKTNAWTPNLQKSLDDQWNQYAPDINKLPVDKRLELLNNGRDTYYKNINKKPDGSPSDAYFKTWKPRLNESVKTYNAKSTTQNITNPPSHPFYNPSKELNPINIKNNVNRNNVSDGVLQNRQFQNIANNNVENNTNIGQYIPKQKEENIPLTENDSVNIGQYIPKNTQGDIPFIDNTTKKNTVNNNKSGINPMFISPQTPYQQSSQKTFWNADVSSNIPSNTPSNIPSQNEGVIAKVDSVKNPSDIYNKISDIGTGVMGVMEAGNIIGNQFQNKNKQKDFDNKFRQNILTDNSTALTPQNQSGNRGDYDVNNGMFRPNETGFKSKGMYTNKQYPEQRFQYGGSAMKELLEMANNSPISSVSSIFPVTTREINPELYNKLYPISSVDNPSQGTISVRNNDPGNMLYSSFTKQFGAIPGSPLKGTKEKYAKFPTIEQGLEAQKALLTSNGYKNLTVEEGINRWINGDSKIKGAYTADTIDPNIAHKKISELNPFELTKLQKGIVKNEDTDMYKILKQKGIFEQGGDVMKIRITGIDKMAYGGQMGYGLDIGNRNTYQEMNQSSFSNPSNTISEVPRDEANIEAEKGETVYGDIDDDGIMEQKNIGGKRHYEGGTPLNVPDGSFIFSDTKKMKIKDENILKYFGKSPVKGGITPADIAKQYNITKYKAILQDPLSDNIAKKTAEMMITNMNDKLSKLALVQESMKGFPNGVPKVSEQLQEKKYGGLTQYQDKGNVDSKTYIPTPINKPHIDPKFDPKNYTPPPITKPALDPKTYTPPINTLHVNSILQKYIDKSKQNNEQHNQIPPTPINSKNINTNSTQYQNRENVDETNRQNSPLKFQDVITNSRLFGFKGDDKSINPTQNNIHNWQGWEFNNNQHDENYNKETEQYLRGVPLTNLGKKLFPNKSAKDLSRDELFSQARDDKFAYRVPLHQQPRGETIVPKLNIQRPNFSGFFPPSNNIPIVPESTPDDVPITKENIKKDIPNWWIQDKINLANSAINWGSNKKYLPFIPDVSLQHISPTFNDWRGNAAALQSGYENNARMSGIYGSGTGLSSNLSALAGQQAEHLSGVINNTNMQNVGIGNQFAEYNNNLTNTETAQRQQNRQKLWEGNVIANQQFDNANREGRNNFVASLNNGITNAANTFNLNTTEPNFRINPSKGGPMEFKGANGRLNYMNQRFGNTSNDSSSAFNEEYKNAIKDASQYSDPEERKKYIEMRMNRFNNEHLERIRSSSGQYGQPKGYNVSQNRYS